MKKLISMLLAGAMVFALAVPALADGEDEDDEEAAAAGTTEMTAISMAAESAKYVEVNSQSMTVTGETNIPKIQLTFPTMAKASCIIVNPYKLKFTSTVNAVSLGEDGYADTQIISPNFVIKNGTNCDLKVSAVVTGKLPSGSALKLVDSIEGKTDNSAKIALEAQYLAELPDEGETIAWEGDDAPDVKTVNLKTSAVKLDLTGSGDNAVDNRITLPTPAESESGELGANYLVFRFTGEAVTKPKTAWTKKDAVNVEIVWNFVPEIAEPDAEG